MATDLGQSTAAPPPPGQLGFLHPDCRPPISGPRSGSPPHHPRSPDQPPEFRTPLTRSPDPGPDERSRLPRSPDPGPDEPPALPRLPPARWDVRGRFPRSPPGAWISEVHSPGFPTPAGNSEAASIDVRRQRGWNALEVSPRPCGWLQHLPGSSRVSSLRRKVRRRYGGRPSSRVAGWRQPRGWRMGGRWPISRRRGWLAIGAARDALWNAIGRPRPSPAIDKVFPDGLTHPRGGAGHLAGAAAADFGG